MNFYIGNEINLWSFTVNQGFRLGYTLFEAVKLTKNADSDKYIYSSYGIGFDASESFSLPDGNGFGKNVTLVGADMSSSIQIDNKRKDNLIPAKRPTQGLDDPTLTGEKGYPKYFTEQQKKFCLSLHYNGVNSYLFVNGVEIYKFKAKRF